YRAYQVITGTRNRDVASASLDRADAASAARGDARAFERIYARHVARIHSLARRMIGPEDADDATQEIFVRAWTNRHLPGRRRIRHVAAPPRHQRAARPPGLARDAPRSIHRGRCSHRLGAGEAGLGRPAHGLR